MVKQFKKAQEHVFYLFAVILGLVAVFYPDKIEAVARSFVLLLGVGL